MKILKKAKSIYTLGHWKHVPVQFHWSILLVLPWYYLSTWKLIEATIALVGYAMLILVHELGHAWVAHWRGLHVYGISLYLFHGQCRVETPYREADDVWVAWGGIGAQILVLVAAILISYPLQAIPHDDHELLKPLFVMLIPINVMTIVINLIPMQPLDGHKAWRFIPLLVQGLTSKKRMRVSRGKTRLKIVARNETAARKVAEDAIRKMMDK